MSHDLSSAIEGISQEQSPRDSRADGLTVPLVPAAGWAAPLLPLLQSAACLTKPASPTSPRHVPAVGNARDRAMD